MKFSTVILSLLWFLEIYMVIILLKTSHTTSVGPFIGLIGSLLFWISWGTISGILMYRFMEHFHV